MKKEEKGGKRKKNDEKGRKRRKKDEKGGKRRKDTDGTILGFRVIKITLCCRLQTSATAAAHKINSAARELSMLAAAGCVDSLQPAAACSDEARSRTRASDEKHGFASLGFRV